MSVENMRPVCWIGRACNQGTEACAESLKQTWCCVRGWVEVVRLRVLSCLVSNCRRLPLLAYGNEKQHARLAPPSVPLPHSSHCGSQGNIVAVRTYPSIKDQEAQERRALMEAFQGFMSHGTRHSSTLPQEITHEQPVPGQDEATWCGSGTGDKGRKGTRQRTF